MEWSNGDANVVTALTNTLVDHLGPTKRTLSTASNNGDGGAKWSGNETKMPQLREDLYKLSASDLSLLKTGIGLFFVDCALTTAVGGRTTPSRTPTTPARRRRCRRRRRCSSRRCRTTRPTPGRTPAWP